MRSFALLLLIVACAKQPRDRLGEERVIDRLTPLVTQEDKTTYLPGERAHIVAYASDPEYREDTIVQIVTCPKLTFERDYQCLGTSTEIILSEGVPRREDELLIYELDYDIPTDIPLAYDPNNRFASVREHVYIRMKNADRHVIQMADLFVASSEAMMMIPPFEQPPMEPLPFTLYGPNGPVTLSKDTVNEIAAGEYGFADFGMSGSGAVLFAVQSFFCTPGCYSPPPPDDTIYYGISPKIAFLAGTEPRLYLLGFDFTRYVISVR